MASPGGSNIWLLAHSISREAKSQISNVECRPAPRTPLFCLYTYPQLPDIPDKFLRPWRDFQRSRELQKSNFRLNVVFVCV